MTGDEIVYIDSIPRLIHRFLDNPEIQDPKSFNSKEARRLEDEIVLAWRLVDYRRKKEMEVFRERYHPLLDALHLLRTAMDALRELHLSKVAMKYTHVWETVIDEVLERCCDVRSTLNDLSERSWHVIRDAAIRVLPEAR